MTLCHLDYLKLCKNYTYMYKYTYNISYMVTQNDKSTTLTYILKFVLMLLRLY